ncbi:nuclease [Lactarius pseudohatsudake]|nr:nuclease [Lactarius pseudohatsudake]
MPFSFGTPAHASEPQSHQTDGSKPTPAQAPAAHDSPRQPDQPDTNTIIALTFLLGSATTLGTYAIYRRFFTRLASAEWVTPNILRRRRWITGVVTRVGDGDNFRLYHTPGFGWRGPLKFRHIPRHSRELVGETIHIRMAAVDAPERSHFGKPAQAHSDEALAWLKEQVHGRRIKCQLFQRDQYGRIVALPLLPLLPRRWWGPRPGATRNLPLEMVRAGWGVVYTGKGAQYGGWGQDVYLAAQAEAQAARRGMWHAGTDIETPAEYKKRYRAEQAAMHEEEPETEPEEFEPEPEPKGILDRIFRRGKSGGVNPKV